MNNITRQLLLTLMISFCFGLSSIASGQYLWQLEKEKSQWGFELSGIFNSARLDMGAVKHDQRVIFEPYYTYNDTVSNPDERYTFDNMDEFESSLLRDLKLGIRYNFDDQPWNIIPWNFHLLVGFSYSQKTEAIRNIGAEVSLNSDNPPFSYSDQRSYTASATAKEFLLFVGYIQPIFPWLEIGVIGSIGPASAEARKTIQISEQRYLSFTNPPIDSDINRKYDHELKADYTSRRIEGRIRINVTRYVCMDMGVGYRESKVNNMRGEQIDSWNNNRNGNIDTGSWPTPDAIATIGDDYPGAQELLFDYSGIFYGAGITLKNPFEKRNLEED
ncbi:MAG: hypothetical protein P9L92_03275 [Candidatus Electryonea clarkiae]|nr:hypothetical protein [Candidatus Electryonea clarkiae]MDP8288409.1 hypothetical protein [Candidatus Electryonea clarkiae]